MLKVAHVKDVVNLTLAHEVKEAVLNAVMILDEHYGEQRNIDAGDGGYVLILESKEEFEYLKDISIDIDTVIPEYVDVIECSDGTCFVSSLVLLSSDFGLVLIMPFSLVPKSLMQYYLT